MAYIELGVPEKKKDDGQVKLVCPARIVSSDMDWIYKELWYEIDLQYEQYLYIDRVDCFVVAVLPYCMKNCIDIKVDKKTGISADLYFQLKEVLIPTMANTKKFDHVALESKPVWKKLSCGMEIATGISRGVDSFYTLLKTMEGIYKPTCLTLFNTQAYGEFGGTAAADMFQQDMTAAGELYAEINKSYGKNIKLLTVDSNIQEELPVKIYDAGSFRDAGAILLLKQLISLYFFSTTISLDAFTIDGSCREFEPWAFACLSTESQRIQPIGADKKRLHKVRYISNYPITYKYLKVCRKPLYYGTEGKQYEKKINCTCDCEKCRCTVLELMAVGKLDRYKDVFDLSWVEEHKKQLLYEVVGFQKQAGELDYSDIYQVMREDGRIDDDLEIEAGICLDKMNDVPCDRDYRILELMDEFFQKVQNGVSVKKLLKRLGYKKVGIYGMGRLGRLLCRELEGELLKLVIDRNKGIQYKNVELRRPDEDFSGLDLIIVTTVYKEEMIKNYLKSRNACDVMTLKEVLAQSGEWDEENR